MAYDQRLESERDFHNKRFGAEEERKEDAFYFAVQAAAEAYWRLVREAVRGKDALEYGCSHGEGSIGLAPVASRITGIDISDVAIGQAKEQAVERGIGNVTFRVDNAEDMKLAPASFDVVFGSGILHHLVLEKARRDPPRAAAQRQGDLL